MKQSNGTTLENAVTFRADGSHLVADNLTDASTVRICTLTDASEAIVAAISLMAVVRSIPVTFLPKWTPIVVPSDPDNFDETKLDTNVPAIEQDTQPELDGFNTDCETCESEVSGQ